MREFVYGLTAVPRDIEVTPPIEVHRFTAGLAGENSYLAVCARTGRAAAIDPGAAAPEVIDAARRRGWSIEAIYLTHAHFDHVEGIPALRRSVPTAPIHLHPADRPLYDHAKEAAAWFGYVLEETLPPPDFPLVPGESVPVGESRLEVRFAPGHAPGHVLLYSPEAGFALVGDVIFQRSIGRYDLPGGDLQTLMESIRKQVLTLPDGTTLYPGHGDETTVREERLGNPFLISQAPSRFA